MSDTQGEGQQMGLLAAMMVVSLLVLGLLLGLVLRSGNAPTATLATMVDEAQEPVLDGPVTGTLTGTVYFAVDSADLTADARAELASVARVLLAQPERVAVLSALHDASGDGQRNAQLALQRAQGVRAALVTAGVALPRLSLHKPTLSWGGEQAELARRVEIRVLE